MVTLSINISGVQPFTLKCFNAEAAAALVVTLQKACPDEKIINCELSFADTSK